MGRDFLRLTADVLSLIQEAEYGDKEHIKHVLAKMSALAHHQSDSAHSLGSSAAAKLAALTHTRVAAAAALHGHGALAAHHEKAASLHRAHARHAAKSKEDAKEKPTQISNKSQQSANTEPKVPEGPERETAPKKKEEPKAEIGARAVLRALRKKHGVARSSVLKKTDLHGSSKTKAKKRKMAA